MYTWDPKVQSYQEYLSSKSYLGELTDAQSRVGSELRDGIDRQTMDIIGSTQAIADVMACEVSRGFEGLEATFNWGFSQLLASMGGMAATIFELVQIAKTPAQTAAYEHFEIARDNYRKGLLEECLDELQKAIEGDHVSSGFKTEWRFHQLEGIVRLGSFGDDVSDFRDPAKAERAFLLAARYARTDEPGEAARAFLSAGFSAYVQARETPAKLHDALRHSETALSLDATLAEGQFQTAKLQMALDEPEEALPRLREAISADPRYVLRAAEDPEHKRHAEVVRRFFSTLDEELRSPLRKRVDDAMHKHKWALQACEELRERESTKRLRDVAGRKASRGLLELFEYVRAKSEKDLSDLLSNARNIDQARLAAEEGLSRHSQALADSDELRNSELARRLQDLVRGRDQTLAYVERITSEIQALDRKVEELARRRHIEVRPCELPVTRIVEKVEARQEDEVYFEDVCVRKAGLLLPAKWVKEKRTRKITVERKIQRLATEMSQQRQVVVLDGFGRELPPAGDERPVVGPLIRVPAGDFLMGSSAYESNRCDDEIPHPVTLTHDFLVSSVPVTNALYSTVTGEPASSREEPDCPVMGVSWFDAAAFCNSLSRLLGLPDAYRISDEDVVWQPSSSGFRLPTEAEWEFAARWTLLPTPDDSNLPWELQDEPRPTATTPSAPLEERAWCRCNSGDRAHPVGQKQPNGLGLHDMLGNVDEWCWDWYGDYPTASVVNPSGPPSGSERVQRGGNAWSPPAACQPTRRRRSSPRGSSYVGFRLVRTVT